MCYRGTLSSLACYGLLVDQQLKLHSIPAGRHGCAKEGEKAFLKLVPLLRRGAPPFEELPHLPAGVIHGWSCIHRCSAAADMVCFARRKDGAHHGTGLMPCCCLASWLQPGPK